MVPHPRQTPPSAANRQEELYLQVAAGFGAALRRLARGYERDEERRRDLLQEIHVALWRSLASFDRRCSLRTWVYRVAQNVATTHVIQGSRMRARKLVTLADVEAEVGAVAGGRDPEGELQHRQSLGRLLSLLERLAPIDRHVMLLYLEGLEASEIGEITGLSASNVAVKVHRAKQLLARRFEEQEDHGR